jgi:hypothetical protein
LQSKGECRGKQQSASWRTCCHVHDTHLGCDTGLIARANLQQQGKRLTVSKPSSRQEVKQTIEAIYLVVDKSKDEAEEGDQRQARRVERRVAPVVAEAAHDDLIIARTEA